MYIAFNTVMCCIEELNAIPEEADCDWRKSTIVKI